VLHIELEARLLLYYALYILILINAHSLVISDNCTSAFINCISAKSFWLSTNGILERDITMSEKQTTTNQHDSNTSIWIRLLYMILFAILFAISETVLYVVAIIGFLFRVFNKPVESNVAAVGHNIGLYVREIADYLSFNTEKPPFPFSNWPTDQDYQPDSRQSQSTENQSAETSPPKAKSTGESKEDDLVT